MALRHAWAFVAAIVGVGLAGCSSNRPPKPPFPAGAENCSTYCLVWVPPVYRDVPEVVPCKPGCVKVETVCVRKTEFDEVCRPGRYEKKCSPCTTHQEAVVQATPGSDRWVKTKCGCSCDECYRHERIPPTYKICDKTVTDAGVEYCAYQEPEYDVVPRVKICKEKRETYQPAEYGVKWRQELFQAGHWQWEKRNCDTPKCAPKPTYVPKPACGCPTAPRCGCGSTLVAPRPGFERAPSRD